MRTPVRAATPVGLQLSWLHSVQFAGSYLALENGWWQDAGLDVTLLQGGPNAPVEPPVVAASAGMATGMICCVTLVWPP